MQLHLDLHADDLDAACALAEEAGARRADFQPNADGHSGERVIIYLDPAGHPFCLFTKVT
jgi:catechol 2,3-dioxygenase-like lactoylglutathione lyase family enzyme